MTTETTSRTLPRAGRLLTVLLVSTALAGCNAFSRINDLGQAPELAPIENPVNRHGYRPVTMPMPAPEQPIRHANSLWRTGAHEFLGDQRAKRVGDLLTVTIDLDDEAELDNSTTRTRANTEEMDIPALAGYEQLIEGLLPHNLEALNPADLVRLNSALSNAGSGQVDREEEVEVTLAAVVTQVLPNGNLVIHGRQEIRVNFEVREVTIDGVIRSEDISNDNTIEHTRIAEARISYGGRGQLTDVQQPRYGSQVLDIILPF